MAAPSGAKVAIGANLLSDYATKDYVDQNSNGFTTEINVEGNSMGSMFKKAEKRGAKFAVIVGENEVSTNTVNIKNMDTKEQVTIALNDIVRFLDMNLSEQHHHDECCCGHDHDEEHECCCHHE